MTHNYHRVDGLTNDEYASAVEDLKFMKDLYCWNGLANLKRILMSHLYYRELGPKVRLMIELFANFQSPNGMSPEAFSRLREYRFDFETRILKLLRFSDPVAVHRTSPKNRWRTNKAHYARQMDEVVSAVARDVLPGDGDLEKRISENRRRWASRDMPSVKRFKKCRKARKRETR